MRSSRLFLLIVVTIVLLYAAAAHASGVDMRDPRRALGREDDVRVDAQLTQETISSSSPLGVTYQVQNFTSAPVAVADRICDVSYDRDTRTITMSIGSEIPADGLMPHVVIIRPGEKKVLTAGGSARVAVPTARSPFVVVPGYVQIKVNVLRDLAPFHELIARQAESSAPRPMSDDLFDRWIEANDAILLNPIPVRWTTDNRSIVPSADRAGVGSF